VTDDGGGQAQDLAPGGDRIAADILRGAARRLIDADHAVLAELPLGNGRRADLVTIDRAATITIVEVKSGRADFMTDRKWQSYLAFCDRFYFAVDRDFPQAILPQDEGLILADRFAGEIIRESRHRPLSAARRKAMLLRFARGAATRLNALLTPTPL
jgi:hypothetical protein